jgi:predicted MFS family arabinose efflux permease
VATPQRELRSCCQAGSFLGAWGGGYLFDLMGSCDLAWKIGVFVGLVAGTARLLMND